MKISIDKADLVSAIDTVSKAAPTKDTTMPILGGVLMEADGKKLTLTRNNLEIAIERTTDCEIRLEGSSIVDTKRFYDVVRSLPDEEVDIETTDKAMSIDAGEVHMEIPKIGDSSSNYPMLPKVSGTVQFDIEQKILAEMVKGVSFAVSQDDNRPVLKGILLASSGGNLDVVAIDGYTMAIRRQQVDVPNFSILPMGTDLDAVSKLLNGTVQIAVAGGKMLLSDANTRITIRTVEGEFMNYKGILPHEFPTTTKITVKELQQAIERSLLFITTEKGKLRYPLIIDMKNDKMALSLNSETGIFGEALPVELDGSLRIGFNPMKLAACLKHVEDKEALIKFTSPADPCIISPVGGDKFTYMVLPVRARTQY